MRRHEPWNRKCNTSISLAKSFKGILHDANATQVHFICRIICMCLQDVSEMDISDIDRYCHCMSLSDTKYTPCVGLTGLFESAVTRFAALELRPGRLWLSLMCADHRIWNQRSQETTGDFRRWMQLTVEYRRTKQNKTKTRGNHGSSCVKWQNSVSASHCCPAVFVLLFPSLPLSYSTLLSELIIWPFKIN